MNYNQLNEHSQKIFKKGCIKHIFPRVKESVQKYASHISEAQTCLHLVEKWLKDEASISSEELREAAYDAAVAADAAYVAAAAYDAAYAAARSAAVARSAVADAARSADAAADAAADAVAADADAAYVAADAAYAAAARSAAADAAWFEARNVEKEWQQRFFNILLRQQQKMKQMHENKIQYSKDFKDLQDCEVVSILRFNLTEENKYPHGLLQSLYKYTNDSEHLVYIYIKQMRMLLTEGD